MIDDIDASLRALIRREVLSGRSHAEISFDAPSREWAEDREAPTVNLYLYEIHEEQDIALGLDEYLLAAYGADAGEPRPGRRLELSYLVTVWSDVAETEHRLLSALLACFLGYEVLPVEVLTHRLRKHPAPCELRVTLPARTQDRADLSLAREGELKPCFDLAVVVPVSLARRPASQLQYGEPAALLTGSAS